MRIDDPGRDGCCGMAKELGRVWRDGNWPWLAMNPSSNGGLHRNTCPYQPATIRASDDRFPDPCSLTPVT
jgi:hypothetical protein